MTIGANSNRDELVETLRGLKFNELDLSFYEGKDADGKQREGYDRYGKYSIKIGFGIGAFLSLFVGLIIVDIFIPLGGKYGNNLAVKDTALWARENLFWLFPVWVVGTYLLWKANRTAEAKELEGLVPAMEMNGLRVLPKGTGFPGDLSWGPQARGTVDKAAFALISPKGMNISFGLSKLWWDQSSKKDAASLNRALLINWRERFTTMFVYVSVRELSGELVYLNPTSPLDWNSLPLMSQKARDALMRLTSKYAVVLGEGGIGVGRAFGQPTQINDSWTSPASVRAVLETCYQVLSQDVADVIEGIS
jgi:hypothetical protein